MFAAEEDEPSYRTCWRNAVVVGKRKNGEKYNKTKYF